jgi:site-specific DNA recombinase
MKKITHSQSLLKDNEKYSNTYLIYNRKSTDEPENQKNSIHYQKNENEQFALKHGLKIAPITIEGFCTEGIISERHSAFKENNELIIGEKGVVQYKIDRPKFHRMIDLLNRGYFKGVVILCWDRISRNKADETIIRKLMKQGVDFRFVLASYDKTSSGALHMDIDGMFAAHHSRVTSEKVKINIRNQKEKGICTYKAPIGYHNTGTMEYKPFDTVRAPIVKRLFEKYATGEYTLASLRTYAIAQGLTMPASRKRRTRAEMLSDNDIDSIQERAKIEGIPHVSSISTILNNPFYIGYIRGNDGKLVKSNSHEPLIDTDLFNKVQNVLGSKTVSIHYSNVLDYPYRGIFRCHECKRAFTPYIKKEIIYYNSRCIPTCSNTRKNFSYENIQELLDGAIEKFRLSEKEQEELQAITQTDIAVFNVKRLNKLDENEREKRKVREDLAYLENNTLNFLKTGVYSPETLIAEKERLQRQIEKFRFTEEVSDQAMMETIKEVSKLSELLKTLVFQSEIPKPHEKEGIIRIMFSELSIFNNVLLYKANPEFKPFENRFIRSGALLSWILELSKFTSEIKKSNQEIEHTINSPNNLANAA